LSGDHRPSMETLYSIPLLTPVGTELR